MSAATEVEANLTYDDIRRAINMSRRYVVRHAPEWPHRRFGRTYRFTEDDLRQIVAMHRKGPDVAESPAAGELRPASRRRRAGR